MGVHLCLNCLKALLKLTSEADVNLRCFESLFEKTWTVSKFEKHFNLDQKFSFFLGTATRLSIRRGRSNSRAYKYSLAVHEPEIQACNSPISGQDAIEECNEAEDDVGELEQVKQLGGEKTESFFTR